MSTTTTWPGGATDATPTAYSIPASGELNWAALSNFLNVLATSAQSTTAQKWAVRKCLTTPVTVSATADCVIVTQLTSPGAVVVNLPAGANKQVFCIVDGTGDAASNNVTINRNGSDTIAGATSLVMSTNREAVILVYNSSDTDWKIVSRSSGGGAPAAVPAAGVVSSTGTALTSGGNDTGDALINTAQGAAGTPTYSFVGDTNTGIYRSNADEISFATGGTQKAVLDANGDFEVGATTGNAHIDSTATSATTPTYSFVGDGNTGMYRSAADTLNLATGGASRLTADSTGFYGNTASAYTATPIAQTTSTVECSPSAWTASAAGAYITSANASGGGGNASTGTLTITFARAGNYMVTSTSYAAQSANTTVGYLNTVFGGSATRYGLDTFRLQLSNATNVNDRSLVAQTLVVATASQTVTINPTMADTWASGTHTLSNVITVVPL